MQAWLVRGVAMGVIYAAAETVLAQVQADHPTSGSVISPIALALLVGVSGLWGGVDGWLRTANRGMSWFYAGLLGGVLAGLLSVAGRAIFVDQTGVSALAEALTGDAAFVALLIMVPAGLGLAIGARLEPPVRKVTRDPDQTGPVDRRLITPSPVPRDASAAGSTPGSTAASTAGSTKKALRRSRSGGRVRGAGR